MSDRNTQFAAEDFARRIDEEEREAIAGRMRRRFIHGFLAGMLFMAVLDLTDIHVCVGECDGAGYDIEGVWK